MKQKFIPLNKRSKKEQREYHAAQRKDWGTQDPATRKMPNQKAYNRKKSKQRRIEHEPCLDFFYSSICCSLYSFSLRSLISTFSFSNNSLIVSSTAEERASVKRFLKNGGVSI